MVIIISTIPTSSSQSSSQLLFEINVCQHEHHWVTAAEVHRDATGPNSVTADLEL